MAQYRFYSVNAKDRLQLLETLDCRNEGEAVGKAARLLAAGQAAELWDGGRLVGRFSKLGVFTPGEFRR